MNILHTVELYYPLAGGMQEVVKQLSERLVMRGHKVTVATTKLSTRKSNEMNGVNIKEFAIYGNAVRGFKGNVEEYKNFLLNSDFDIVVNFNAQQWATDIALPILDRLKAKKVFVPTGFSALYNPEYKDYFKKMAEWMKSYDMNIFLSWDYRDINFAREHGINKLTLIPNGAGMDEFNSLNSINIRKLLKLPEDTYIILTVGTHTKIKGHNEAIKIFDSANIKNAALVIAGNVNSTYNCRKKCISLAKRLNNSWFNRQRHKQIIVSELTREEIVVALKQSNIFLFPSNIECSPVVLFEAMAGGIPFLSTDVGNASEIIRWSHGGMLLPTAPESFVQKIGLKNIPIIRKLFEPPKAVVADIEGSTAMLEMLYKNKKLARELAKNGHTAWKKNFTWEKIAKDYEKLYQNLTK